MSFGELVKQHRTRNGMTMKTFSEGIGISIEHLRRLENGESSSPSALIVARMVTVLHLNPFEVVTLLNAVRKGAENKE